MSKKTSHTQTMIRDFVALTYKSSTPAHQDVFIESCLEALVSIAETRGIGLTAHDRRRWFAEKIAEVVSSGQTKHRTKHFFEESNG